MKIALLTRDFKEKVEGGLSANYFYTAKGLSKLKNEVHVFSYTKGEEKTKRIDGFILHKIKKPHLIRWTLGKKYAEYMIKNNMEFDIIHAFQPMPFGWLFPFNKVKGKKILSIHNSTQPFKKSKVKGLRSKLDSLGFVMLTKFLIKKVDGIITVAEFIKKELSENKSKKEKIKVVHTGVNFKQFNTKIKKIKKNKFTIMYAGRFVQKKGLPYLIEAVKGLDCELILVGGQKEDNDYSNVINTSEKNKKIKIIKSLDSSKLIKLYKNSDVFVLPSIMEPFAKVLLEAMASGIPVIATKQGGVPELINNGKNGILVEPKNSDSIRKAIIKIMKDKKLRKKIAENGKKTAKEYDWSIIAKKTLEAYKKI